jgi:molybdopterin-binding protein
MKLNARNQIRDKAREVHKGATEQVRSNIGDGVVIPSVMVPNRFSSGR